MLETIACACGHDEGYQQVAIELTEACNYRCVMCDYWRIESPRYLDASSVLEFMEHLRKQANVGSVLLTGGEPTLHPKWREISTSLAEHSPVYICTNGSRFATARSGVFVSSLASTFSRVTISLDGPDRELFAAIRGKDHLEQILSGIAEMRRLNGTMQIFLKVTILPENFRRLADFVALATSHPGSIDGIGFGIGDFSGQAFGGAGLTGPNSSSRSFSSSEAADFERETLAFEEEFAGLFESGFIYEGDFEVFRAAVARKPRVRECCIPAHGIVVWSDGSVGGCYYLAARSNLTSLLEPTALSDFLSAGREHVSNENAACSECVQLLIRSSPFSGPDGISVVENGGIPALISQRVEIRR